MIAYDQDTARGLEFGWVMRNEALKRDIHSKTHQVFSQRNLRDERPQQCFQQGTTLKAVAAASFGKNWVEHSSGTPELT
jgi:hypothetical protein